MRTPVLCVLVLSSLVACSPAPDTFVQSSSEALDGDGCPTQLSMDPITVVHGRLYIPKDSHFIALEIPPGSGRAEGRTQFHVVGELPGLNPRVTTRIYVPEAIFNGTQWRSCRAGNRICAVCNDVQRAPGELLLRGPSYPSGGSTGPTLTITPHYVTVAARHASIAWVGEAGALRTGALSVRRAEGPVYVDGLGRGILYGPTGQCGGRECEPCNGRTGQCDVTGEMPTGAFYVPGSSGVLGLEPARDGGTDAGY